MKPKRKTGIIKVSDIVPPTDYDIHTDGTTQSLLSHFPICRQRYLFAVNRWVKLGADRIFFFGNIFHDVLDVSYSQFVRPNSWRVAKQINKYVASVRDKLSDATLEDSKRIMDVAHIVLDEYFKYYPEDFEEKEFVETEEVFEVPFHGYILKGKKDAIFLNLKRLLYLMENKTKGRIEEDIIEDVLNFDFQNLFYIVCDNIEYEGDLSRVLYNIIRNPGQKKGKKESYLDYLNRIRTAIQKEPEYYFIRYECPYNLDTISRFKRELLSKLQEADLFLLGELPLYRNESACKLPFRCTYLDACASGDMVGYMQQESLFPELEV